MNPARFCCSFNKTGYKNGIYAPVTYRLLLLLLVDRLFSALFSGEKYSRVSRFLEPQQETQAGRFRLGRLPAGRLRARHPDEIADKTAASVAFPLKRLLANFGINA